MLAIETLAPVTAPALAGANVMVTVADCPGVKIVPFEMPLALKPAPLTVTPEIVIFEFPLFVTVDVNELLLPTVTVLKFRLVGLAPSTSVAAVPVPDRPIARGEGVPFVTNVSDPVTLAAEVGVKIALKLVLPPAAIVVEVESPVKLMPEPAGVICENVSAVLPLFVKVIGCELLLPTTTLPKPTLDGDADIWACSPVPVNGMVVGEPGALLVIETAPLAAPAAVGVNVTVNEVV